MPIELRQLRYFVAVAEEKHFGRAAQKLHMTQPPLSQAILALEAEIGTPLFLRNTRNTQLTAAGNALLPEANRLIAQAHQLPSIALRAASGETGELRLAFISIADYSILPPVLREFRHQHGSVKIELQERTSDQQFNLLERGEIDAGLLIPPIPEHLRHLLEFQRLRSEKLLIALPENSPNRAKPDSLASYKNLPLILFPRKIAPAFHDTILGSFRSAGITPNIEQEAIQMQTIVALVSAGMGMALVPESMANLKRAGVRYQAMQNPCPTVEIGVAWRRDNPSPVLQAFLNLLEK
ncbi:LysR family transcriptional regulator [Undibacterium fentianense]|uniref:LysR family transcriptional regulator n=1 Tax=Undibacterium fentianense TaxID=2828728 RepID=A0A941IDN2_9BURK|nr:LysR family transcriptional regulator [Undibacterium fentianense]MBR7800163.1 LysR family transcriptional regulator [Undibacterium fentianense]